MSYLDSSVGLRLAILGILAPTMVLLPAAVLSRICRRASAAARHLVWLLAFVSMAIWMPLTLFRIRVALPVLPPTVARSVVATDLRVFPWQAGEEVPESAFDQALRKRMNTPPFLAPRPVGSGVFEIPRGIEPMEQWARRWGTLVVALWFGGVGILAFRWLAGVLRLRHIAGESRAVDDDSLRALWVELCSLTGLRRTVRLSLSANVSVPLVAGAWRPRVILPAAALTWPAPMRRAALVHELAHIRRNDLLSASFVRLVTSLYWFNPLAWRGLRALQAEAEMAADDCVVMIEAEPVAYAESLVALVRTFRESGPLPVPAIGMLRRAGVEARIERILNPGCRRLEPAGRTRLGALIAVALLTLGFVILRPVAAAPRFGEASAWSSAGETHPFDPAPFHMETAHAPPQIQSALSDNDRAYLGLPAGSKEPLVGDRTGPGVRLALPIGPVRIEYGVPLQRTESPDHHFNPHGDFPGPGYREQKVLPSGPAISVAESGEVSSDLQAKITAACQAAFHDVASVRFSTTAETVYAEAYLSRNPDKGKMNHQVTVHDGVMADDRFRVSSNITQADGVRVPEFQQTYDGNQHCLMWNAKHPWLEVHRSFVVDSGSSVYHFGTAVFLPYTFLYLTSDDYFVPNLSINRVTDKAAWAQLFKQARVLDNSEKAGLMRIKFTHLGGTYYIVTFSTDDAYYPIGFEKYGPGGLAQRYLVEEFATAEAADKVHFRYPRKAKFESFLNGWPRDASTVEMTSVAVNGGTKGVDFTIDPSMVEQVFDGDAEKTR